MYFVMSNWSFYMCYSSCLFGCFLCKKVIHLVRERKTWAAQLLCICWCIFEAFSLTVDKANDFCCLHYGIVSLHICGCVSIHTLHACVCAYVCTDILPLKHPLAAGSAICFCTVSTSAFGGWLKIQRSAWQTSQTKHTHKHMFTNDAHRRKNAN